MLPKLKRITKKDFIGIKPKMVFRGTYIDVAIYPSDKSRFSCIISKKRVKKAVDRNKIKRKIYSILEKIQTKKSHLVFVYPKQTAISSNHKLLLSEIEKVFDTL